MRKHWHTLNGALEHRSGSHCERCGFPVLMEAAERHHRKLRSQGGEDKVWNLVLLCPGCHQWVHAHPRRATYDGFIVPSWADPLKWPVLLAGPGLALLTEDAWYELTFTREVKP